MEIISSYIDLIIISTVFVAVMLVLRLFLKKTPKWVNMLMWSLVAIRLMCPFVITSSVGVVPEKIVDPTALEESYSEEHAYFASVEHQIFEDKTETVSRILFSVWLFGTCLMLSWGAKSYSRLNEKAGARIRQRDNVFICDDIDNGFVLGLIRPKILVPSSADPVFTEHIVRHELVHIKHKDHIWKVLSYILLSFNWFNPIIWIAFICFSHDMELYCDEEVTRGYTGEERATYAYALLSLTSRQFTPANVAFGEVALETRIRAIGRKDKHCIVTGVMGVVTVLLVSVFFLTNAKALYRSEWSYPEFEVYYTLPEGLDFEYSVYDYYSYNELYTIRANINGYLSSNWEQFSDSRDNISYRVEDCLYEPGNNDLVVYFTVFAGEENTSVRFDCVQEERGGYLTSATILDDSVVPALSHPIYEVI